MKKLNIGCGLDKKEGWINLDISKDVKPDIVQNIENGLPFQDNDVDRAMAYDILEQISTPRAFIFVMNEIWRILKPEAELIIRVPNAKYPEAFQDPMDCRRFTEDTFTYMKHGDDHYKRMGKHYGFMPWKIEPYPCPNERLLMFKLIPVK